MKLENRLGVTIGRAMDAIPPVTIELRAGWAGSAESRETTVRGMRKGIFVAERLFGENECVQECSHVVGHLFATTAIRWTSICARRFSRLLKLLAN